MDLSAEQESVLLEVYRALPKSKLTPNSTSFDVTGKNAEWKRSLSELPCFGLISITASSEEDPSPLIHFQTDGLDYAERLEGSTAA